MSSNITRIDRKFSVGNNTQDSDGDGIANDLDNCIKIANPEQRDTDNDSFGNRCDGDLNNDGKTNTLDLNLYKLYIDRKMAMEK